MSAEQIGIDDELKRRQQRHMQNILELRSFLLAPVSQPKWKRTNEMPRPGAARARRDAGTPLPQGDRR